MRIRLIVLMGALFAASSARADDQSIADFKAPPARAGPVPPPAQAAGTPATAVDDPSQLLPARMCLLLPHGYVVRAGGGYEFTFDRAPLVEAVEAVARIYSAAIACPGPVTAEMTGSFTAGALPDALAQLAGRAGRRLCGDGGGWILEGPDPRPLGVTSLADLTRSPTGSGRAKGSP